MTKVSTRPVRTAAQIVAVVLLAASTYCAFWFFSSSDLAFLSCQGRFALFGATFRCRQPYIAVILGAAFLLCGVGILFTTRRKNRNGSAL